MKQEDAAMEGSKHAIDAGPTSGDVTLGRWALGLGIVSTLAYYATSEGMRNFTLFVIESANKALRVFGHGA